MTKIVKENKVLDKIKISEKDNINKFPIKNNDKNKSNIKARNKKIVENINNFSKSDNNFLSNSENIANNHKYHSQINENENETEIKNNKAIEITNSPHTHKKRIKKFFDFILFKLFCQKKFKWFKIYNNFRIKIISEEYLFKNHLNIYNILRAIKNKRRFRRNSYKLKDLIKLI